MRRLHKVRKNYLLLLIIDVCFFFSNQECVEGNNAAKRPLNALLGKLTGSMGKFTWFDGANEKGQPLASVPVVHGGAVTIALYVCCALGSLTNPFSAATSAHDDAYDDRVDLRRC